MNKRFLFVFLIILMLFSVSVYGFSVKEYLENFQETGLYAFMTGKVTEVRYGPEATTTPTFTPVTMADVPDSTGGVDQSMMIASTKDVPPGSGVGDTAGTGLKKSICDYSSKTRIANNNPETLCPSGFSLVGKGHCESTYKRCDVVGSTCNFNCGYGSQMYYLQCETTCGQTVDTCPLNPPWNYWGKSWPDQISCTLSQPSTPSTIIQRPTAIYTPPQPIPVTTRPTVISKPQTAVEGLKILQAIRTTTTTQPTSIFQKIRTALSPKRLTATPVVKDTSEKLTDYVFAAKTQKQERERLEKEEKELEREDVTPLEREDVTPAGFSPEDVEKRFANYCKDTDGGEYDYFSYGEVIASYYGKEINNKDKCESNDILLENYCDDKTPVGKRISCSKIEEGAYCWIGRGKCTTEEYKKYEEFDFSGETEEQYLKGKCKPPFYPTFELCTDTCPRYLRKVAEQDSWFKEAWSGFHECTAKDECYHCIPKLMSEEDIEEMKDIEEEITDLREECQPPKYSYLGGCETQCFDYLTKSLPDYYYDLWEGDYLCLYDGKCYNCISELRSEEDIEEVKDIEKGVTEDLGKECQPPKYSTLGGCKNQCFNYLTVSLSEKSYDLWYGDYVCEQDGKCYNCIAVSKEGRELKTFETGEKEDNSWCNKGTVGTIKGNKYCSLDVIPKDRKEAGDYCGFNAECMSEKCVNGICKETKISGRVRSFFNSLWLNVFKERRVLEETREEGYCREGGDIGRNDYTRQGYVEIDGRTVSDECVSSQSLNEVYCDGKNLEINSVNCYSEGYSSCKEGECICAKEDQRSKEACEIVCNEKVKKMNEKNPGHIITQKCVDRSNKGKCFYCHLNVERAKE